MLVYVYNNVNNVINPSHLGMVYTNMYQLSMVMTGVWFISAIPTLLWSSSDMNRKSAVDLCDLNRLESRSFAEATANTATSNPSINHSRYSETCQRDLAERGRDLFGAGVFLRNLVHGGNLAEEVRSTAPKNLERSA